MTFFLLALFVFLVPLSALAQTLPSPDDGMSLLSAVFQAVSSGQWRLVAALAVIAVAFVLRNVLAKKVAWFSTKAGGYVISYTVSLAIVLAPVIQSGQSWSWKLALSLLSLALTAAGGYEALREVLWPLAKKVWGKLFG